MEHRHPCFARLYALSSSSVATRSHRMELLSGLSGRVVEVGCGDGTNFALYPKAVTSVLAVEPEPYLRRRALRRAGRLRLKIEVIAAAAEAIPAGAGQFDAAVCSLVLCSVRDPLQSLQEIHRLLRPGGQLRIYEHVASQRAGWARAQRRASPWWGRVAGGCQLDRDPLSLLAPAGFALQKVRRFDFPSHPRWLFGLVSPHVLALAVREE